MEIAIYGMIILIGILIVITIQLSISMFRAMGWIAGIITVMLAAMLFFCEYMVISKAIAEKIIGG